MVIFRRLAVSRQVLVALHLPDDGEQMNFPLFGIVIQGHLTVLFQLFVLFLFDILLRLLLIEAVFSRISGRGVFLV